MMSVWSCLIFTFALLKNMKLCPGQHYILGHSAVISDTVYLKQLLMAKELIGRITELLLALTFLTLCNI